MATIQRMAIAIWDDSMASIAYHYNHFSPSTLDYAALISFIGPANAEIARYDGVLYS